MKENISAFDIINKENSRCKQYYEWALLAEKYIYSDPHSSLGKWGTFCEQMVAEICDRNGLNGGNGYAKDTEALFENNCIDIQIKKAFDYIRRNNNISKHNGQYTVEIAQKAANEAYIICTWYIQTFYDSKLSARPYIVPSKEEVEKREAHEELNLRLEQAERNYQSIINDIQISSDEKDKEIKKLKNEEKQLQASVSRLQKELVSEKITNNEKEQLLSKIKELEKRLLESNNQQELLRNTANEKSATNNVFKLTKSQEDAINTILNSKENFFITGEAGTGKSEILKRLVSRYESSSINIAKVAPTGFAALNISGVTIHSFFGIGIGPQDYRDFSLSTVAGSTLEKLRKLDVLVIDEASMIRADLLDMVDMKMRRARNSMDKPFGGCQVLFFGDLYQLPPIVTEDEEAFINSRYDSPYFFSSKVIEESHLRLINLTEVCRQEEAVFKEILSAIRKNESIEDKIQLLNSKCVKEATEDAITITSTRAAADKINFEELDKIQSEEYEYVALEKGLFVDEREDNLPTNRNLKLKVGAKVLMVKNDTFAKRWINGTEAKITDLKSDAIQVQLINNSDTQKYWIGRAVWEKYRYLYDSDTQSIEQEVVGTFYQFPVRLAYAITIHKSQGQTYESVKIDFTKGSAFAEGQTYVALSRCKTIDRLYLAVPLAASDVIASSKVKKFLDKLSQEERTLTSGDFDNIMPKASVREKPLIEKIGTNQLKISAPQKPKKITGTKFNYIFNAGYKTNTPFKLWCSLVRLYEEPYKESIYTEAGRIIEPIQYLYVKNKIEKNPKMAGKFEIKRPDECFENTENLFDFFPEDEVFGGKWDYIIKENDSNKYVIEMKTAQKKSRQYGISKAYVWQAELYASLLGIDTFCIVISYLDSDVYSHPEQFKCDETNTIIQWYKITEEFTKRLKEALQWWKDYVLTGISPKFDLENDKEVLQAIFDMYPEIDSNNPMEISNKISNNVNEETDKKSYYDWNNDLEKEQWRNSHWDTPGCFSGGDFSGK